MTPTLPSLSVLCLVQQVFLSLLLDGLCARHGCRSPLGLALCLGERLGRLPASLLRRLVSSPCVGEVLLSGGEGPTGRVSTSLLFGGSRLLTPYQPFNSLSELTPTVVEVTHLLRMIVGHALYLREFAREHLFGLAFEAP